MTMKYVVPPAVYSLAVMGTYLDLIDQDLPANGDPLKILYAQRIGFFPTMTVIDGREIVDRVNRDLAFSHIPLERFLNGLIKNRLLVQAQTMVKNIESRYSLWYQTRKDRPKLMTDTMMDNRAAVYLPNAIIVGVLSKLVNGTITGEYQKVTPMDGSPYVARMNEVRGEFETLCRTAGQLPPAPFPSTRFFPLVTHLVSILKAAVDDPEELYSYRMLPIMRIIYILCRMFNGDIKDPNYDAIFATTGCDANLYVSDATLAIMSGATSEVLRSLGIHEQTPISRKGQFYLTACDSFAGERDAL